MSSTKPKKVKKWYGIPKYFDDATSSLVNPSKSVSSLVDSTFKTMETTTESLTSLVNVTLEKEIVGPLLQTATDVLEDVSEGIVVGATRGGAAVLDLLQEAEDYFDTPDFSLGGIIGKDGVEAIETLQILFSKIL